LHTREKKESKGKSRETVGGEIEKQEGKYIVRKRRKHKKVG